MTRSELDKFQEKVRREDMEKLKDNDVVCQQDSLSIFRMELWSDLVHNP